MALEPLPKVIQRSGVLRPGEPSIKASVSRKSASVRQENSIRVKNIRDSGSAPQGGGAGEGRAISSVQGEQSGRHAPFRALHPSPKGSGIRGIP